VAVQSRSDLRVAARGRLDLPLGAFNFEATASCSGLISSTGVPPYIIVIAAPECRIKSFICANFASVDPSHDRLLCLKVCHPTFGSCSFFAIGLMILERIVSALYGLPVRGDGNSHSLSLCVLWALNAWSKFPRYWQCGRRS
jgi:hypothetical protein